MYQGSWRARTFRSWRWGYSSRFRAASTFLYADHGVRTLLTGDPTGPALWGWPDPVLDDAFSFASMDPGRWERTSLRLIRVAARYQQSGEVLDLADPFGDRLKTLLEKGRLRLWSVSYDGVDNGGDQARDLVLQLDR
jgi:hypothetical protein